MTFFGINGPNNDGFAHNSADMHFVSRDGCVVRAAPANGAAEVSPIHPRVVNSTTSIDESTNTHSRRLLIKKGRNGNWVHADEYAEYCEIPGT